MRVLARSRRRWGIAELARELDLPKGTVHGLVRTLVLEGLIEQDVVSRKYHVGPGLLSLGFAYLESSPLRAASMHPAQVLAHRSREKVQVGMLDDAQVLIVHSVLAPGDDYQALDVGSLVPTSGTALGRALVGEGARQGWTAAIGEPVPGVASIAAPIQSRAGTVVGAIGVQGSLERLCKRGSPREQLVHAVLESARTISRQLG